MIHNRPIYHCPKCGAVVLQEASRLPPFCCGHVMVKAGEDTLRDDSVQEFEQRPMIEGHLPFTKQKGSDVMPAYENERYQPYLDALREQVCSRCIERPPGGPPCLPLGKRCGLELNLPQIVDAVHQVHSNNMEPYAEVFHDLVCTQCANRTTSQCPCPMDYLLLLAVQAIEEVDERLMVATH